MVTLVFFHVYYSLWISIASLCMRKYHWLMEKFITIETIRYVKRGDGIKFNNPFLFRQCPFNICQKNFSSYWFNDLKNSHLLNFVRLLWPFLQVLCECVYMRKGMKNFPLVYFHVQNSENFRGGSLELGVEAHLLKLNWNF